MFNTLDALSAYVSEPQGDYQLTGIFQHERETLILERLRKFPNGRTRSVAVTVEPVVPSFDAIVRTW